MITPRGRSTVWVRLDMWLSSMPVRWNMAQHMYVPAWPDGWDIFVMLWVLYAYKTNLGYYSVPINWIYLTLYGLLRTPCILLCGCSSFSLGLAARGALLEHATHCVYNLTWIPAHMRQTMQLYHLQTNSDLFRSSAGLLENCSRWEYWLV